MFNLGAPEVLVLLLELAGVVVPCVGFLTGRLRTRDAIIAVVLAILLPAVGSVAAILITITRAPRDQLLLR